MSPQPGEVAPYRAYRRTCHQRSASARATSVSYWPASKWSSGGGGARGCAPPRGAPSPTTARSPRTAARPQSGSRSTRRCSRVPQLQAARLAGRPERAGAPRRRTSAAYGPRPPSPTASSTTSSPLTQNRTWAAKRGPGGNALISKRSNIRPHYGALRRRRVAQPTPTSTRPAREGPPGASRSREHRPRPGRGASQSRAHLPSEPVNRTSRPQCSRIRGSYTQGAVAEGCAERPIGRRRRRGLRRRAVHRWRPRWRREGAHATRRVCRGRSVQRPARAAPDRRRAPSRPRPPFVP